MSVIRGTEGADTLRSDVDDVVLALGGDDTVYDGGGTLFGGTGDDVMEQEIPAFD